MALYTNPSPSLDLPRPAQAAVVGAATAPASGSIVAEEIGGTGLVRMTKLTLTSVPFSLTYVSSSIAYGSVQLYDLPKGAIFVACASARVAFAGLTGTYTTVASVGSTVATSANATLTTTEADVIASTSSNLTSGAGSFIGGSSASLSLDGTGTAKDLYLNAATSSDITSTKTGTVSGYVILVWMTGGDPTIA